MTTLQQDRQEWEKQPACPNHNPKRCDGGTICLTCGRFFADAGSELKSSYRMGPTDAERLDYLSIHSPYTNGLCIEEEDGLFELWINGKRLGKGTTLREAIDAAIDAQRRSLSTLDAEPTNTGPEPQDAAQTGSVRQEPNVEEEAG